MTQSTGKTMLMSTRSMGMYSGIGGCRCRGCFPIDNKTATRRMFRRMMKRRERQGWQHDVRRETP